MSPFRKPILRYFALWMIGLGGIFALLFWLVNSRLNFSEETSSILFQFGAILPLLWMVGAHLKGVLPAGPFFTSSIRPFRWQGLVLVLILGIASSFAIDNIFTYGLSFVFPGYVEDVVTELFLPFEEGTWPVIWTIILAVLIGPLMEEVVFRGLILNRWLIKYGYRSAIIWSSLIFGLLHGEAFLGATLFGVLMCILYLHSKSLWVPIIVHVANNSLAVILEYYAFDTDQVLSLANFREDLIYYLIALLALPGVWFFLKEFWLDTQRFTPYELESGITETTLVQEGATTP